jgi:hypothetical protein
MSANLLPFNVVLANADVNYEELARCTEDFNGAQLKAVCVEVCGYPVSPKWPGPEYRTRRNLGEHCGTFCTEAKRDVSQIFARAVLWYIFVW